ncbi:MAG: aminotransferase class I/II-fold pyridoxal phosphate-dependent enzyme [Pseudomonadota bacterium]
MGEPVKTASRMAHIQPFHVMELLARARALEARGHDIVHMEIGEPDFATPASIVAAGHDALEAGHTHYTPAVGLPALREAISDYYRERFGVSVLPERIVVTPGASTALQLIMALLVGPGDQVLLTDPGYPCNRNFVHLVNGESVSVRVTAENGFRATPENLMDAWTKRTRALMVATPANPTGTCLAPDELKELEKLVAGRDAVLIVDEIYQGLTYDGPDTTALALGSDHVMVVNSFSKYFGMTGWRIGWLVAPEPLVPELDKLAQNLYLSAPTISQHAAIVALSPGVRPELDRRRDEFRRRRDFLYPRLASLGFSPGPLPGGAFYLYADSSAVAESSFELCERLLVEAGVAITPGIDFGAYRAESHVRFAYTTSLDRLELGVRRLEEYLSGR